MCPQSLRTHLLWHYLNLIGHPLSQCEMSTVRVKCLTIFISPSCSCMRRVTAMAVACHRLSPSCSFNQCWERLSVVAMRGERLEGQLKPMFSVATKTAVYVGGIKDQQSGTTQETFRHLDYRQIAHTVFKSIWWIQKKLFSINFKCSGYFFFFLQKH